MDPQRQLLVMMQSTLHGKDAIAFDTVQTHAACLAAVRASGLALEYILEPSAATCLAAVEQTWRALRFVPPARQEPDVVRAALLQSGLALQHAAAQPPAELCLLAVERSGGVALRWVATQSRAVALAAVRAWGGALEFARGEDALCAAVCLAAVRGEGAALRFVPRELQTPEVCLAAVAQDGLALRFVVQAAPAAARAAEIVVAAVEQNPLALKYARAQSAELAARAVAADWRALEFAREQTPALCAAALAQSGLALKHVRCPTREMAEAAVAQTPDARQYARGLL